MLGICESWLTVVYPETFPDILASVGQACRQPLLKSRRCGTVRIYSIGVIPRVWEQGPDSSVERSGASDKGTKRLIERLREEIRLRYYSLQTEKAYWYWIRYFILFHGKRHPAEMGATEVTAFLSFLATERNVA